MIPARAWRWNLLCSENMICHFEWRTTAFSARRVYPINIIEFPILARRSNLCKVKLSCQSLTVSNGVHFVYS